MVEFVDVEGCGDDGADEAEDEREGEDEDDGDLEHRLQGSPPPVSPLLPFHP